MVEPRGRTAPPTPQSRPAGLRRWWGQDLDALYDRFWAARAVHVVRRGSGALDPRGPSLFLLVEPGSFAFFEPKDLRRTMSWLAPRVVRLRIVDLEPAEYREEVVADEAGRFLKINREYRARTRATGRAFVTPDPRAAAAWAAAPSLREGWREIRRLVGDEQIVPARVRGRLFRSGSVRAENGALWALLESFRRQTTVLEGVYEFQPGVWLHETTEVSAGARFVPPVWIGAGRALDAGEVVVGPAAVPDRPEARALVTPVDWENVRQPDWPFLIPSFRGRRIRRVTKRAFDIAFSLLVLGFTLPIYPLAIALIVLEDGWPPFFAHRRQTLAGREFPCLKFRTMRKDAEKIKATLMAQNQADGPQFFIKDDPRLLRCGKWLRRFQIDELPQFINVLLGHMSVVGPRPSPDKENQFCPAWREARLSVRPGVTGLWQIRRTRAPETDFQEWIRYDLEYVQHESWGLDLWIIYRTIKHVLTG
ncbi:MAG TPA: hypothetical protein DEB06_11760 [Phycisphaerales bacterium]|nr:hypothetical protein [Phycisphaerales bacterium]